MMFHISPLGRTGRGPAGRPQQLVFMKISGEFHDPAPQLVLK
jgi:hypothetical protein